MRPSPGQCGDSFGLDFLYLLDVLSLEATRWETTQQISFSPEVRGPIRGLLIYTVVRRAAEDRPVQDI